MATRQRLYAKCTDEGKRIAAQSCEGTLRHDADLVTEFTIRAAPERSGLRMFFRAQACRGRKSYAGEVFRSCLQTEAIMGKTTWIPFFDTFSYVARHVPTRLVRDAVWGL